MLIFLLFIFDFDIFYHLKTKRELILKLLKTEFIYDLDYKYILQACITM